MTKDYKRFYHQQNTSFKFTRSGKNSQARKFFGPSVRAVVERGKTQSSRPPADQIEEWDQGWGTNTLRDSEEFRKNFEEIPSSVQDSEILGLRIRIKHKKKAMGWWKNTWKCFITANVNRIKPIISFITLENKHVVISWSSASASLSDNLAPVVQKLDSALARVRRFPSQFITVTYPRRTSRPRDPKFGNNEA